MSRLFLTAAATAALACATPAVAQTVPQPVPPWISQTGPNAASQAEAHRQAIDRLRYEADRRAAFSRQQAFETRLRRFELEAARQPTPTEGLMGQRLGTPEQERARREAATSRRQSLADGIGQIDAWLDRPAR